MYRRESEELWSSDSKLAYAIRDDIPVLIPAEARELNNDEIASLVHRETNNG